MNITFICMSLFVTIFVLGMDNELDKKLVGGLNTEQNAKPEEQLHENSECIRENKEPKDVCRECMKNHLLIKFEKQWTHDIVAALPDVSTFVLDSIYLFYVPLQCDPVWDFWTKQLPTHQQFHNFGCNFANFMIETRVTLLPLILFSCFSRTLFDGFLRQQIDLTYSSRQSKMIEIQKEFLYRMKYLFDDKNGWKIGSPGMYARRAFMVLRVLGITQGSWYTVFALVNAISAPFHGYFYLVITMPLNIGVLGDVTCDLCDSNRGEYFRKWLKTDYQNFVDKVYSWAHTVNQLLPMIFDVFVVQLFEKDGYNGYLKEKKKKKLIILFEKCWMKNPCTQFFKTIGHIMEETALAFIELEFLALHEDNWIITFLTLGVIILYNIVKNEDRNGMLKFWFQQLIGVLLLFYGPNIRTLENLFVPGMFLRGIWGIIKRGPWIFNVQDICAMPNEDIDGEYMIPGEFLQSSCFSILHVPGEFLQSSWYFTICLNSFVVSFGWATMLGAFEENSWISKVFRTPCRNGIAFIFVMVLYWLHLTFVSFLNVGTVCNLTIFTVLGLILKLVPTIFSFIDVFKNYSEREM